MTTSTVSKPFEISNNFTPDGNTFVAVFKVLKSDTFSTEQDFERFLNRVKNEVLEAKAELFTDATTDALGGFDIQAASAGVKGDYVVAIVGGSASTSLLTPDPKMSIGAMIGGMLNTYYDKEYVLSQEVRTGEFNYTILALDVGGTVLFDDLETEVQNFMTKRQSNESSLWSYASPNGGYYDYSYPYYNIGLDVAEMSVDLAFNLFQNSITEATTPNTDCSDCTPDCNAPDCDTPDCSAPDCDVPSCDVDCGSVDCGDVDCGDVDCSN